MCSGPPPGTHDRPENPCLLGRRSPRNGAQTEEDRFLALLQDHHATVRRIARVYAGADGEEEDLCQEILMQIWRSLPTFQNRSAPATWLYRVALNTALTWQRRAKRHATRRALSEQRGDDVEPMSLGSTRSQTALLLDFLESLGGLDRSVLLLFMEGLSHQEIADVSGLTVSAVGSRIHRIRRAFTERFMER